MVGANSRAAISNLISSYNAGDAVVIPPSFRTLTAVGITFAIPAIGFGFVDNFLMIIAGDYIDNSIGVAFGTRALVCVCVCD